MSVCVTSVKFGTWGNFRYASSLQSNCVGSFTNAPHEFNRPSVLIQSTSPHTRPVQFYFLRLEANIHQYFFDPWCSQRFKSVFQNALQTKIILCSLRGLPPPPPNLNYYPPGLQSNGLNVDLCHHPTGGRASSVGRAPDS